MIISHAHRFIFIKTRKTAGTSVEIALSGFCGPDDVITPIAERDERARRDAGFAVPRNYEPKANALLCRLRRIGLPGPTHHRRLRQHASAREVRANVTPEIWDGYYKFCFERNPFDKAISLYFWTTRDMTEPPSISRFLEGLNPRVLSNWHMYATGDGVAVDFVGRFETLEDDFAGVCEKIGVAVPQLTRAKSGVRADARPYAELLSSEDRTIIERACASEIDALGYRWEAVRSG